MCLKKTQTAYSLKAMLASAALLLMLPGASHATHYYGSACGPELNRVEDAISNGEFLGKRAENDRSHMLTKLEAAHGKIVLTKYSDAIDKLSDISDAATKLANAPKPKLADATSINGAAADAIYCVAALR